MPRTDLLKDCLVQVSSGPLEGYLRFKFDAMQGWLEEDDPIYVHPMDPYKRVDIRRSTRSIQVSIDGVVVADTPWAMHLFEKSLPTRYYLPRSAIVDWGSLTESELTTSCPYKGDASYFHATINGRVYKDIIWWYKHPTIESSNVAGMVRFFSLITFTIALLI